MRLLLFACIVLTALPALAQHQPVGQRFEIKVEDLPPPRSTPSVSNSARHVPRPEGARLNVPAGFAANLFADGFSNARTVAVAPNGDVFLAEPRAGRISIMRDADNDGIAEVRETFAEGLERPHGLAFRDGYVYVGELTQVRRLPYRAGDLQAGGPPEQVTPRGSLGEGGGHSTRNIVFAPDGGFYVSVGSRGNVGVEPEPRATIQRFDADGGDQRTFAAGLRNAIGMTLRPGTAELWTVVNERDGLGDGLVPDYLALVEEGAFYGWPYAYAGTLPDPDFGRRRPDLVARSRVGEVLFQSHSAPIDLAFYDATQFPEEYRGDLFVTLQGSWNSSKPTGYVVARVPFENGRPLGYYETFVSGFWVRGTERAEVWGRPSGIAVARDGSLLVAEDVSSSVWRIAYVGR